ncbi:hypothetical protein PVT71_08155 [Salipiger sp. H15]|uniref:EF-hand domain-containing protein n=1 Tax=Alloyangia sp. H15 TaxID=3029062 RepID=A0AAU8ACC3_9RHOB
MKPLIAAATALLLSATALAAQPQGNPGDMLKQMDRNGDGKVTLAEAEAQNAEMFTRLDSNRDGVLSEAEARPQGGPGAAAGKDARGQAPAKGGQPGGPKLDSNGDGKITKAEFKAGAHEMFTRMDRNGDGVLSGAELTPPKRPGN